VDAATAGGLLVVSNGVYQSGVRVVDGMGTLTNPPQLWLDLTDPMPPARFYRVWQAETPNVLPAADLALATELTLTGTPGTNLRVDWINRYGPIDAWVTLATVPLTSASQTYVDLTMFRQPPRLYRLVPVP
jgi:anaerobic selenocysteine-containing dehydrogenase